MRYAPSQDEAARRKEVMTRVLDFIQAGRTIKLPVFDAEIDRPSDQFALVSIGLEPNDFSGTYGEYRYQFEGEEDLLHLIVTHKKQETLPTETGQEVAAFVFEGVPPALIWLKPGDFSQHFYVGHDHLIESLTI